MDDLADKIAKLGTDQNPDRVWAEVTATIRSMPRHHVPLLWGALLRKLATEPPAMPQGYITQDQWMAMCTAQYQELYRCALVDAGVDGMHLSGGGNASSGGASSGAVASSNGTSVDLSGITKSLANIQGSISNMARNNVDLTPITSQLDNMQNATYRDSIASMAADKVAEKLDTDISDIKTRHDELLALIADMAANKATEQQTIEKMIQGIANKVDGVVAEAIASARTTTVAESEIQPTVAPQPVVDLAPTDVPVVDPSAATVSVRQKPKVVQASKAVPIELPDWITIDYETIHFTKIQEMLEYHSRFLTQKGKFKEALDERIRDHSFRPIGTPAERENAVRDGSEWIWKCATDKLYVSQLTILLLLNPAFFATKVIKKNMDLRNSLSDIFQQITLYIQANKKIEAPLLAILLNRYSYENKKYDQATQVLSKSLPYEYTAFPFNFEKTEAQTYHLNSDVTITESLAQTVFFPMYNGIYNPFTMTILPTMSALKAEWDAEEWFDSELSNPSKPIADAWFSSIASTLSARSASPSKGSAPPSARSASPSKQPASHRSASPSKPIADMWFSSIASTLNKQSASPSKRSASPGKHASTQRSASPAKPIADMWFSSIASTLSKRSTSPSKRSASPSKPSNRSASPSKWPPTFLNGRSVSPSKWPPTF